MYDPVAGFEGAIIIADDMARFVLAIGLQPTATMAPIRGSFAPKVPARAGDTGR